MTSPTPGSTESNAQRRIRKTVAILLVLEASLFFMGASFIAFFSLFMGGLAFAAGAGGASEEQVSRGWYMILFMMVAPYVWPVLLAIGAFNLLERRRLKLAAIAFGLTIVIQLAVTYFIVDRETSKEDIWTLDKVNLWIGIGLLSLAGMVLALYARRVDMKAKAVVV